MGSQEDGNAAEKFMCCLYIHRADQKQPSEMRRTQHCCLQDGKWMLPNIDLQTGLWQMDFGAQYSNFNGFSATAVSAPVVTSHHMFLLKQMSIKRADPERGGVETVGCSLEHRRGENLSFATCFHGGSNLLQAAGEAALAKTTFKIRNFHSCCHLLNCGSPSPGEAEPLWNVYILRLGRKLLWHFF